MKQFTDLKIEDLNKLGDYTHDRVDRKQSLQNDKSVMQGHWAYQLLGNGLSMHFVDMEEKEDVSFSNQSTAGISFNIVYKGKVDFTLGTKHHTIQTQDNKAICGCFALNKPEMRTRHTKKNTWVKKVNVFAEKQWLLDRAQSKEDQNQLNNLLNTHGQLFIWQPCEETDRIVNQLIQTNSMPSFTQNLHNEASILHLLSLLLSKLFESQKHSNEEENQQLDSPSSLFVQCIELLNQNLETPLPLTEIAEKLNVSVSTLQRRFKEAAGMTVVEYIRLQRLDKARRDLVEGKLSIGEIAYHSGYKHVANFVSAFKREYAMSPAAYRKLHLREPTE